MSEPATGSATSQVPPDMREIAQLISAFDASTARLKESHDTLQERIAALSGELSRKNEELQQSLREVSSLKNYLANILESITDGVLAIDLDRRVVALNQAAAEAIPGLAAQREGGFVLDVLPGYCRGLGLLLLRSLSEQRRFTNEAVELQPPAGARRILSVSVSPIRSEGGAVLGAVQTFRDLTEIKDLEERAARRDRLAALGEMAAGVAHEIRNPLGGIELYASHLQRSLSPESREEQLARKIIEAATRLNKIVTDMLTFTRSRAPLRRASSLVQAVRGALDLAASQIEARQIAVACELPDGLPLALIDVDLMMSAFLNVILNAVQVMEPGQQLAIAARVAEPQESGPRLVIEFADQGPGVPVEASSRIFDPFFSLRQGGTGLGLAIVQRIVQDHGGTIEVGENEPRGAVFRFVLPLGVIPAADALTG